jgi:hypothetical protein
MRPTVAQLLRSFDVWLPVRRVRMTGTVTAAIAGYLAMIVLQLSLVAPVPGEASTASLRLGGLLSVSDAGVCVLPVCLLSPTCGAAVGGSCLLPPAAPPPPVAPAPRAPVVTAPAPAAPPPPAAAPAVHVSRVVAPHVAVVPAAPPPKAPPASIVIVPVDRPVAAAPVDHAPPPATSGALHAPTAVVAPRTAAPAPVGSPWWLYVIFGVVDLAALVALAVLIRRTAAAESGD